MILTFIKTKIAYFVSYVLLYSLSIYAEIKEEWNHLKKFGVTRE